MEEPPRPRLCYLTRGERGYGFHLHGERSRGGQFIRRVDAGSPADLGGLRPGDRLVEVNGQNVENESHHEVVERIREVSHRTRLLVVDRETEEFLHSRGLSCTEDLAVEMGNLSPRLSPMATPSASPVPREISLMLSKPTPTHDSPTQGRTHRSSESSSTAADSQLQVESSPEPPAELLPRLCRLLKGPGGFGFNLHSNKRKAAQFVRAVDPDSPAERAGVRPGDRLLEVNGVSTEGLGHSEVVSLIRTAQEEVRLLVVDPETDELFRRLGVRPSVSHIREVYVDDMDAEISQPTSSRTPPPLPTHPPVINVTLTDSPVANLPPKPRTNGSSASLSSRSSTTQSEISSSDMSIQVPDEDERRVSDPFLDSGLRLSPTAAEARLKVLAGRSKKRAPPMDWSKKQQVFSNF